MAEIHEVHLSFVWNETLTGLITAQQPPADCALSSFATQPGYVSRVNDVQNGSPGAPALQLPWPHPDGQSFWAHYLGAPQLKSASGSECFHKLVPLHFREVAGRVKFAGTEKADIRIAVDGYFYPHGTALAIKLFIKGTFTTSEIGKVAQVLRRQKVFKCPDIDESALLSLDALAADSLDNLRNTGFGDSFIGRRSDPYSIATIVQGSDVLSETKFEENGPAHKLLHGLANWTPNWEKQKLPPLKSGITSLPYSSNNQFEGHMLYAGPRGVAVWFPEQFNPRAEDADPIHTLACYHRNLAFASMQTDSFLRLVEETESLFQRSQVGATLQTVGEIACVELARFWSSKNTYSSYVLRSQIERSRQLDMLNSLRTRLVPGGATIPAPPK